MKRFKYHAIEEGVKKQIYNGVLLPGDMLPSVRSVRIREKVSIGTVIRAYRRLEAAGVIEGRSRSGFYVLDKLQGLCRNGKRPDFESKPIRSSVVIAEFLKTTSKESLLHFGTAIPASCYLPLRKLRQVSNNAIKRNLDQAHLSVDPKGLYELRRMICNHMFLSGCSISPDQVIVTNGCTEAMALALQAVTQPGDAVAIQTPAYYGTILLLKSLGLRAMALPVTNRGIDLNHVEEIAHRKLVKAFIITANFQNPTSALMEDSAKAALVLLTSKARIPLIENDIYGDLAHPPLARPKPLKSFDHEGDVLYCNSFSKTLSPSYRLGWICPGRSLTKVRTLKLAMSLSTNGPSQYALAEFIRTSAYVSHLKKLRHHLHTSVKRAQSSIARQWPDGVTVNNPCGGFLLWIELPVSVSSFDMYELALKENISIAPGTMFSITSSFQNYIRLNCAQAWNQDTHRAIKFMGELIANLAT